MQMHEKIKDLMYEFVKFLDNNSLYSRMTVKKEEWEAINTEHERIDWERRNIAEVRRIMPTSRWDQKLLDIWTSEKNSSLYRVNIKWLYQAQSKQQDAENVYGNKELREIELQAAYQQVELILYRDSFNSSRIRSASASAWLDLKSNFNRSNLQYSTVIITRSWLWHLEY